MQDLVDAHQQDQKVETIVDGHDARHRILAERLTYLRARIACPERRPEKLRLEALEADMLAVLEHLTGQHDEAQPADSGGGVLISRHRFERTDGRPVRPILLATRTGPP